MLGKALDVVLYCHEIAMLELRSRPRELVRLVLVHRYAHVPGRCSAGEECCGCWLLWRGKQYEIPLSATHLLLVDYLSHQRGGKTAAEIADGLRMPFYIHHGSNSPSHRSKPARTSRTAVRKQVQRIRAILAEFFAANRIALDPFQIILTESTSTLEVKYRLSALVSWDHPEWHGLR